MVGKRAVGMGLSIRCEENVKRIIVILTVILVLAMGFWLLQYARKMKITACREKCVSKLRSIGAVLADTVETSNGTFPSNMVALMKIHPEPAWFFTCPLRKDTTNSLRNVDDWMDYIYAHWPGDRANMPEHFPLLYDRRLSNHEGMGINILRLEGSGTSFQFGVFWDKEARWLKDYSAQHPEWHIRVPGTSEEH